MKTYILILSLISSDGDIDRSVVSRDLTKDQCALTSLYVYEAARHEQIALPFGALVCIEQREV